MNIFPGICLELIQSGWPRHEYATLQVYPQKNSRRAEKSGDLGGQFKSRNREIRRCGNISRNFFTLIRAICDVAPSCWYHIVACVFPTKFPCMLYVPMVFKTSSHLALYTTQRKNIRLLSPLLWVINNPNTVLALVGTIKYGTYIFKKFVGLCAIPVLL
jgi:hypothetical protein